MAVNISPLQVAGEQLLVVGYPLKRPASFAVLTAAELEVTEGVIQGLTPRQLSRQRGVSERTVSNQLANIYKKLGVSSKHELLALVGGSRGEVGE
jgi:DNA-binding CsgD family transcriptional regulator